MPYITAHSITGKMIMKDTESSKFFISLVEKDAFRDVIAGLYDFVIETNADADSAYDWVCDQLEIDTFVADTWAWDMFYEVWQSAATDAGVPDNIIAGDSRY